MIIVSVVVKLKPDVMDPQGQAILQAGQQLGFVSIKDLRAGRYFELTFDSDDKESVLAQAHEICDKLLANPVIETYTVTLEPGTNAGARGE